jgi:anti-sigma factor RsiW
MKCDEIRETMLDVAAGVAETTRAMNDHLRGCADCTAKLAAMRQTMALLDEWEAPEPSQYFDTRLAARMREERAKSARPAWLSWWRAPTLVGAFALILMMVGGVNWFGHLGKVTQEAQLTALPGTAVGDLQTLDQDADLYADYDVLDDLQAPAKADAGQNSTETP